MAVVAGRNASAFAATMASALNHRLSRAETDRALSIARVVVDRNGGVALTASEALLVSRYLLYSLNLTVK